MPVRRAASKLIEQVESGTEAGTAELPTPIAYPCSVCGVEGFASYPDDTGPVYCFHHYPTEDPREYKLRMQWTTDPRPDIKADSALWHKLLSMAWDIDGKEPNGLFGILHGARCCGAQLMPVPPDKVRLVRGEYDAEEWAMVRESWLVPHGERLQALLERVRAGDGLEGYRVGVG